MAIAFGICARSASTLVGSPKLRTAVPGLRPAVREVRLLRGVVACRLFRVVEIVRSGRSALERGEAFLEVVGAARLKLDGIEAPDSDPRDRRRIDAAGRCLRGPGARGE